MVGSIEGLDTLRIAHSFLAEHAKAEPTGLVSVVGGGLSRLRTSELPCPFSFYLVAQLVRSDLAPVERPIEVRVRRPAGDVALSVDGGLRLTEGDTLNIALGLSLMIDTVGNWTVEVRFGPDGPVTANVLRVELQDMDLN